jgi:hypothetical protein
VTEATIEVPDFRGMQALNAWLVGHDHGLLLQGPYPDSGEPLMHGIVIDQRPAPRTLLGRWDVVTVWIHPPPDDDSGVREPVRPLPPVRTDKACFDED